MPAPVHGESIHGYVRRLAATNGFERISTALSVLGLRGIAPLDDPRSERDDPWERLSWLTGLPAGAFQAMRWQRATSPIMRYHSDLVVLGARLRAGLLDANSFRICPDCVAETGIVQTAWAIRYSTACDRHGVTLLETCPTCASSFERPREPRGAGPWRCVCGSDLRSHRGLPAPESALRLARTITLGLTGANVTVAKDDHGCSRALDPMPLNDLITLVNTLGIAATTKREQDTPMRIGNPSFPFAVTDLPVNILAASRRIEAAFAILNDWPCAFHSLLSDVAHRFPPSQDRRPDKRVFASRIGKMLLYPPCDLLGRPLAPIYKEVFAFCRDRLGLKLSQRGHHTVDGLARQTYAIVNVSTLARRLGVSSSDRLLTQVYRTALKEISDTQRSLPTDFLATLIEERVLCRYRQRLSSFILGGVPRARGHDRPEDLGGLGSPMPTAAA